MSTKKASSATPVHPLVIDAFRELRDAWFNSHLRISPHEREWEDETAEELRERQNAQLKAKYDAQTEDIICGRGAPVSPRCAHDMSR